MNRLPANQRASLEMAACRSAAFKPLQRSPAVVTLKRVEGRARATGDALFALGKHGRIWGIVLACAACCLGANAQETNRSTGVDYPSFKIIVERNIFNANRSGRRETPRETRRPTRVDSFALVGTMSYDRGSFAFFDGTSEGYRKALQPGGTIAGYQVTDVAPDGVKLKAAEKEIEMSVGKQMRREDEGEWTLTEGTGDYSSGSRGSRPSSNRSTNRQTEGSTGGSGGGSGADASEVLKRLMERRQQENE